MPPASRTGAADGGAHRHVAELTEALTAIGAYTEAAARLARAESPEARERLAQALDRCRPQIDRASLAVRQLYKLIGSGGG